MRIKLYTSHLGRSILGKPFEIPKYIEVNNDFSKNKKVNIANLELGKRVIGPSLKCSGEVSVNVGDHKDHYCCCCL